MKVRNSPKEQFERIYKLALTKNESELQKLYDAYISVNIRYQYTSPITKLAAEGHHDSVKLLADKFEGSLNLALLGYATVNNHSKVKELINIGANYVFAIEGYIYAGNDEYADEFIQSDIMAIDRATFAYARMGKHHKVEALLARNAQKRQALIGYIHGHCFDHADRLALTMYKGLVVAAITYAEIGMHERVEKLIKYGIDKLTAILGYAMGGFYNLSDRYLLEYFRETKDIKLFVYQLEMYSMIGHSEKVNEILESHDFEVNLIQAVADGYAADAQIELSKKLFVNENLSADKIVIALANSRYFNFLNELLYSGHEGIYKLVIDGLQETGAFRSKEQTLFVFCHIDKVNRQKLIDMLIAYRHENRGKFEIRSSIIDVCAIKEVIGRSKKIKKIMEDKSFNYWQALAWYNIDFRIALLAGVKSKVPVDELSGQLKSIHPIPTIFIDDVIQRAKLELYIRPIKNDLKTYGFFSNDFNAFKIAKQCSRVKDRSELIDIVHNNVGLMTKIWSKH